MNRTEIQIGDVIKIRRGFYWHFGVYVGRHGGDSSEVIHNDKYAGVVLSTMAGFAGGREVLVHRAAPAGPWDRQAVVQRARSLIGKKYDLLNFNCEHAANLSQTGRAESEQVSIAIAVILFAVAIWILWPRIK